MADTAVSLVGNVTRDPELRYTPSGQAVAEFGMAVQNRVKNGDQWEDGPGQFFDVTVWGSLGENVAESIFKGTRIVVMGTLKFESWETDAGEKRSKVKIVADAIGPDLRWATADVSKVEKGDRQAPARQPARRPAPAEDDLDAPF